MSRTRKLPDNAFYFDDRYFLLPKDCADIAELEEKHRDGKPFPVTELIETYCLAPYFVREYTNETTLKLKKKSLIFPFHAEVLSMAEYNQHLRQVIPEHCPGCPNFGTLDETDESLEGHHEEITLDGVCFYRNEVKSHTEDYHYVDMWISRFVRSFGKLGLEAMIDQGDYDGAAGTFMEALGNEALEPVPPVVTDLDETGKYVMITTVFMEETDALIMEFLFDQLQKKYKKKWRFFCGIPKGYTATTELLPSPEKPLGISMYRDPDNSALHLTIYCRENREAAAYLWMCEQVGEPVLANAPDRLSIKAVPGKRSLPRDAVDPEAFDFEELEKECGTDSHSELCYPGIHTTLSMPGNMDDMDVDVPEEELIHQMTVNAFRSVSLQQEFVFPVMDSIQPLDVWGGQDILSTLSIPIARLVIRGVPIPGFDNKTKKDLEDFARTMEFLFDKLAEDGLFCKFSQVMSPGGVMEMYGLVLNLRAFQYKIRRMAPIFDRYPAELFLYTASHRSGGHWKLDFKMKRLETEKKLWDTLEECPEDSSEP